METSPAMLDPNLSILENKLARLNILIDHLRFAILFENEQRQVSIANQGFLDLFKISGAVSDYIGLDCPILLEKASILFEDPEGFVRDTLSRIADGVPYLGELIRLADGRMMEREYIPVKSEGQFLGHLWKYRDVTRTYRLQHQLRASEEKYRGIMENMELGLLEVDNNEVILRAYPAFCLMTGYEESELIGKSPRDIFLPPEYQLMMEEQARNRTEGMPGIYEIELIIKGGERIWVLISGAPFFDEEGKVAGSVGIHYDITHIKKLQQDLIDAKQEAESARDAEKQFLANMSHEIRNPLHAIEGMNNLLYDTKPTQEQLQYLDGIKYGSEILQALISDVLDIAKIQEGQMQMNPTRFQLHNLVKAICSTAAFRLEGKPVELKVELAPSLDRYFVSDTNFLNQILLNLVNNAIKFTENGSILVSVQPVSTTEKLTTLEIKVQDTGIGIQEQQLPHIFERFRQADPETKLKYGGTGLGLFITRQLVELLGGEIRVESTFGNGTSFLVRLNLQQADGVSSTEKTESQPEAPKLQQVLIVEYKHLNRMYLEGLLKQWSIRFYSANHGKEALDLIDRYQFDLVLMDIRMPVMDGYETTLRLRDWQGNPNQHIPVIALTASALLDEREKALAVGMNEHVTKPFSPDQLKEAIARVMKIEKEILKEAPVSFWPSVQGIDTSRYSLFYGEDVSHAEMMLDLFIDLMPGEIEQLEEAVVADDKELTSIIVHRLKPSIGMVGFSELEQAADVLEHSVGNMSHDDMSDAIARFILNLEERMPLIKNMLHLLKTTTLTPPEPVPAPVVAGEPVWKEWDSKSRAWVAEGKPLFGPEGLVAWLWENYQSAN